MPLRHKGVGSAFGSLPQEGEVVVIKEQDTLWGTWIMGRIEEIIVGEDGNVRSAKVRTPSISQGHLSTYQPSISIATTCGT